MSSRNGSFQIGDLLLQIRYFFLLLLDRIDNDSRKLGILHPLNPTIVVRNVEGIDIAHLFRNQSKVVFVTVLPFEFNRPHAHKVIKSPVKVFDILFVADA